MKTKIRINPDNGAILVVGNEDQIHGKNTYYVENIPSDFLNTFALGKYIAPNGIVEEVPDWVDPNL